MSFPTFSKIKHLPLVIAVLVIAVSAYAEERRHVVPIAEHLAEPVEQGKSPGLFAAVIDEEGVKAIAVAGVRKQGSSETLTANDQVHLGSLTKAMTCAMLETLVRDGTFPDAWHTTVADVFPELTDEIHPDYRAVNLFQLVRMKSGIGHYGDLKYGWRDRLAGYFGNTGTSIVEERHAMLREILMSTPVGPVGKYKYSSPAYVVAGAMAEKLTGKSWEALMKERLLTPLGITTAGFGAPGTPGKVDQPWGHRRNQWGEWVPNQFPHFTPSRAFGPAGSVYTSIQDYAKFIALWFPGKDPAILDRNSLNKLVTPDSGHYAAGWSVSRRNWAKGIALRHTGSNGSWQTRVAVAPNRGVAYMAAANARGKDAGRAVKSVVTNLINEASVSR